MNCNTVAKEIFTKMQFNCQSTTVMYPLFQRALLCLSPLSCRSEDRFARVARSSESRLASTVYKHKHKHKHKHAGTPPPRQSDASFHGSLTRACNTFQAFSRVRIVVLDRVAYRRAPRSEETMYVPSNSPRPTKDPWRELYRRAYPPRNLFPRSTFRFDLSRHGPPSKREGNRERVTRFLSEPFANTPRSLRSHPWTRFAVLAKECSFPARTEPRVFLVFSLADFARSARARAFPAHQPAEPHRFVFKRASPRRVQFVVKIPRASLSGRLLRVCGRVNKLAWGARTKLFG